MNKLINKEIKLLMIDDDEEDFMIVNNAIKQSTHHDYILDWASSYEDGLKKITEGRHDVYLIDYGLLPKTGLELIKEAIEKGCKGPLIILIGQYDLTIDLEAMHAGAADIMTKGTVSTRIFENSIRYAILNSKHLNEMNKLNAELEKKVKDRTIILEETLKDLEESRAELNELLSREKKLNEVKTRIVSTVSHEFRTPLTVILSSLMLLTEYCAINDIKNHTKHVDKIKLSVTYLTEMLNDMLSLSEQEEGKTSKEVEMISIPDIVNDILNEMKLLVKDGQIINYSHNGQSEGCYNRKILKHILVNAVSNAIKFSQKGKLININTEKGGSNLKIVVEDYGIGISEKDKEHIFERFFRGQNAVNIKGTGLGLNIIYGYVKALNGSVHISSQLDQGTSITIQIPEGSLKESLTIE